MTNYTKEKGEMSLHVDIKSNLDASIEETRKKLDMLLKDKANQEAAEKASKLANETAKKEDTPSVNKTDEGTKKGNMSPEDKVDQETKKKEQMLLKDKAEDDAKRKKVALIKNQLAPELITKEWMGKLSRQEQSHMQRVMREHGPYLSMRDRELLRGSHIILKRGEFYNVFEYEHQLFPKPLTKKQIEAELLDRMESDRIEKIYNETGIYWQMWEIEGITHAEWLADQPRRRAEEAKNPPPKLRMRADWTELFKKENGWEPTDRELKSYMYEHESESDRLDRECQELVDGGLSSFRGGRKIYDHEIHRVMRWCAAVYIFYTYPWTFYATIAILIVWRLTHPIVLYFKFKRQARAPFKANPRSRYSTARQYDLWEKDRKYFGFDKEDEKKKTK